jgi:RNA polymerase sigma-70 factor (ECF subfamily)
VTVPPKKGQGKHVIGSGKKRDALFRQPIELFAARVYRVGFHITRNAQDAEDVQQETFLKAWRNFSQFEGRSLLSTWVTKIAHNEALMCLRKRRSAFQIPLEDVEDVIERADTSKAGGDFYASREGPEAAYLRKELRISLMSAISSLQPIYRVVFILRAVQQLSTRETAQVLRLSPDAVKARMRRARLTIQAHFWDAGAMKQLSLAEFRH